MSPMRRSVQLALLLLTSQASFQPRSRPSLPRRRTHPSSVLGRPWCATGCAASRGRGPGGMWHCPRSVPGWDSPEMRVAYLHLPRFPVQRRAPLLAVETPLGREDAQPLALVQEVRGVQRVACLSTSASVAGVRVGMTLSAARALLPALRDLPYHPEEEALALCTVAEGLLTLAPATMSSAPDGFWLDASAASLVGGEEPLVERALALL